MNRLLKHIQYKETCANRMTTNQVTFTWQKKKNQTDNRAGKIAQWAKRLSTKLDDLSSLSGIHMTEEKNRFTQVVLCPPHVSNSMHTNKNK